MKTKRERAERRLKVKLESVGQKPCKLYKHLKKMQGHSVPEVIVYAPCFRSFTRTGMRRMASLPITKLAWWVRWLCVTPSGPSVIVCITSKLFEINVA